jgi:uncharacterized protein YqiB (DUF1249 family)
MKAKYIPDLTKQMALCEANYARLLKLMPDIDACQQREFIVDMAQGQSVVSIVVQERFKFTCTLSIAQKPISKGGCDMISALISPTLIVRLYHDAKMAEVISPAKKSQYRGKYSYPNKSMLQIDEKIQLNEYLAQWLSHCLTHGYQHAQVMSDSFVDSN